MQTASMTMQDGITYNFNADGSCINRWEGAADMTYYDSLELKEKSIGTALATRDYINNIGGGTGSMFGEDNITSSPHILTPDTVYTWEDNEIYDDDIYDDDIYDDDIYDDDIYDDDIYDNDYDDYGNYGNYAPGENGYY